MSEPPSTFGARIIWVPPSRSRASLGAQLACPDIVPPARAAVRTARITPSQTSTLRAVFLGPVRAIVDLSMNDGGAVGAGGGGRRRGRWGPPARPPAVATRAG